MRRVIFLAGFLLLLLTGCASQVAHTDLLKSVQFEQSDSQNVNLTRGITTVMINSTAFPAFSAPISLAKLSRKSSVNPTAKPLLAVKSATPTEKGDALTIIRIRSLGVGNALMEWHAEGKFSKGFKMTWSKTKADPIYPDDSSQSISEPTSRSAPLRGDAGVQYFYRICKFDGQKCTLYSNSYAFTFDGSTQPTATGNKITISNISKQSQGKALVSWNAAGNFPKGIWVVWSATNAYPVYPGDESFFVSDGSSRSAVINGIPGMLDFFRVCEFNGIGCSAYSQSVPFRFAAVPTPIGGLINITSISNLNNGKAIVKWNAEGSFPNGFKVVWSLSNPNPVYPGDEDIYLSDPSARSAQVSGMQEKTYYFRVCRLSESKCDIYSQSAMFTYGNQIAPTNAPPVGQISILSMTPTNPGRVVILWNASGNFSKGFRVVWSDSNPAPIYPGNANVYLSDPGARSAQVSGSAGKSYYFRVCRFNGVLCDLYSSAIKFTFTGNGAKPITPLPTLVPLLNTVQKTPMSFANPTRLHLGISSGETP